MDAPIGKGSAVNGVKKNAAVGKYKNFPEYSGISDRNLSPAWK